MWVDSVNLAFEAPVEAIWGDAQGLVSLSLKSSASIDKLNYEQEEDTFSSTLVDFCWNDF
jgi:hypothetical protein